MSKRAFINLLKYLLGFGLLAWVVWTNWKPATGQGLADALAGDIRFVPLLLAGTLYLATVLLSFVRWYVLVRAQDLPFALPEATRLGLVGLYFNTFLPGSVGGDIIKAAGIARQQERRTVAVATVLLDRAIGLCGLIWLVALLGAVFWASGALQRLAPGSVLVLETITLVAVGLTVASVVFWLLLGILSAGWAEGLANWLQRAPKVGGPLAELWRAVWMYRCRGRSVGLALGMSVIGHIGNILAFYFAALTLTPAADLPTLGTHFLLVPVGMAIQAGFPTPGGVGGTEVGYGWLYTRVGAAAAGGVLAALVQRVLTWILGLAGYLVYLRMRPRLPVAAETPAKHAAVALPETPPCEAATQRAAG